MNLLLDSLDALRAAVRPSPAPDAATRLASIADVMKTAGKRRKVAIADLNVDPQYQRPKDREKVKAMRRDKTYRRLPIEVNERPDGTLWITDGQHRAFAADDDGETHIEAVVTHVPQHREQERETGVMKEVKRVPQGDPQRGRIHPGEFTAGGGTPSGTPEAESPAPEGQEAGQDGEDTVGVTPYRGSGKADASYFNTTRWKHFVSFAKTRASEMHVSVDAMRQGTGMWEGDLEPTSAWYVHDHGHVEEWAATVGREFNQDAVAIFHEDDEGPHNLFLFTGIHPRVVADATAVGLSAATVTGGNLSVIATDEETEGKVLALAKRIGKRPASVAGSAEFISREEYDRYAKPDEEGEAGPRDGGVPGEVAKEQGRIPAGDPRRGTIHPGEWTADEARAASVAAHAKARAEGREKPKETRPETAERRRLATAENEDDLRGKLGEAETLVDQTLIASRMGSLRERAASGQMELEIPSTLEEAEKVLGQRKAEREKALSAVNGGTWYPDDLPAEIRWQYEKDRLRAAPYRTNEDGTVQYRDGLISGVGKDGVEVWGAPLWRRAVEWVTEDVEGTPADPEEEEVIEKLATQYVKRMIQRWPNEEQHAEDTLAIRETLAADPEPLTASGAVLGNWYAGTQARVDTANRNVMSQRQTGDLAQIVKAERAAKDPVLEPQKLAGVATRVRHSNGQPVAMFLEDSPLEDGILYAEHSAPLKSKGEPTFNFLDAEYAISSDGQGPTMRGDLLTALEPHIMEAPGSESYLRRAAAHKLVDRILDGLKDVPMPNGGSWTSVIEGRMHEVIDAVDTEHGIDGFDAKELLRTPMWQVEAQWHTEDGGDGFYPTLDEAQQHVTKPYAQTNEGYEPEESDLEDALAYCIEQDDYYFQSYAEAYGQDPDESDPPSWSDYANDVISESDARDASFGTVRPEEEEHVVEAMLAAGAEVAQSDVSLGGYGGSWAYRNGLEPGKVFKLTLGDTTVSYLPHTSTSLRRDTTFKPVIGVDPATTAKKVREFLPTWVREHSIPASEMRVELRNQRIPGSDDEAWGEYRLVPRADLSDRYKEHVGTEAIRKAVADYAALMRANYASGKYTDLAPEKADRLEREWEDAFEGIPDEDRVLYVHDNGDVRFARTLGQHEEPPRGVNNHYDVLSDVMPSIQSRESRFLRTNDVATGQILEMLPSEIEGLPSAASFEGKEEELGGRKMEVAQAQVKRNLVGRNHDMMGAAKVPALGRSEWKILLENDLADVTFTEPEGGKRMAKANESGAPFSERGMLRVENATPGRAVNVLKRLKLTSGLTEEVPYNVLYHGDRRLGRVQPRHPDFITSDRKVKLRPGRVVIHGLTAKDGSNIASTLTSLFETGGVQATSERRRVGIDVRTSSIAGDTGSGLDQYVFCTYGDRPQFGSGAYLLLKPTALERRDIAFAPTDFGGGQDRWGRYNDFASQIGQGKFYKPPTPEQRDVALSRMDAADSEVLLKHSIPWEDVDTLIVDHGQGVEEAIEEAKKKGQIPQGLKIEYTDGSADVTDYIERREPILREAYEKA